MDLAEINAVEFLKIDAQGADLAVVRSAGDRLKNIRRISLEVQITPFELYAGASRKQEVLDFLGPAGFRMVDLQPQTHGQEEVLTFERG